jgi:hypothetical protein
MEALHFGKETVIHIDHRPLQFIQTQGKLQNDHHQKWSTYLQQFHLNIKYKKGSTNNVLIASADHQSWHNHCARLLWARDIGVATSLQERSRIRHIYQTLLEGKQVPNFHLRMHCYATWDTFVFLQVSVPR